MKWEYKTVKTPLFGNPDNMLSEFGAEGWEAVNMSHADGRTYVLFKRKV